MDNTSMYNRRILVLDKINFKLYYPFEITINVKNYLNVPILQAV